MDDAAKKSADIEPPQHIQDFIFVRELSEVYLLLDHISGRWDKTLYGNAKLPPPSLDAQEKDWIERICEIGWPPKGTESQQAQQAATLLRAKDRLNAAAKPATGATIAFTLLVVGEDNPARDVNPPHWRRWMNRMGGAGDAQASDGGGVPPPRPPAAAGFSGGFGHTPSRVSLARTAFPGLVSTAGWFKWEIRAIVLVLFLWLIFTCALSWNVAIGHAILVRLDALQVQKADIAKKIASAELNAAGRDGKAAQSATQAGSASAAPFFLVCDQPNLFPEAKVAAAPAVPRIPGVDEMHICAERQENTQAEAVGRMNLDDWMVSWRWVKRWQLLTWTIADPAKVGARDKSEDAALMESAGDQEWGRILTVILANAVLPLCYGFLGAEAAVVRDLWSKMRESLLSPRDLTLALGQLALGAITGACIGLFVSPSGVSLPGESGHVGAIALTGSALSFIAGFGVEGVFVALEGLVKRVFNLSDSTQRT